MKSVCVRSVTVKEEIHYQKHYSVYVFCLALHNPLDSESQTNADDRSKRAARPTIGINCGEDH